MTTLQTGTKVLIEATVEKYNNGVYLIQVDKSKNKMWLALSDLTVCETAQTIDLSNFCIDITDPVNAELLPGFKEWFIKKNGGGIPNWKWKWYGLKRGGVDVWDFQPSVSIHTLPDLQKQHPGVFNQSDSEPTPSFKAGQEWISVADDMPEDGAKVLCYSEKYNDSFTAVCHNKDNDGRFEFSDKCFYWAGTEVSHWMPLPTRPIPAQPTAESELTAIINEHLIDACCDVETGVNRHFRLTGSKIDLYKDITAWHQKHSGRVEVSVPTYEEWNAKCNSLDTSTFRKATYKALQHFMTRKEQ